MDHEHDHVHHDVKTLQPQGPRQANPDTIIRTMGQELARVNDNRIVLLSLIDDLQADLNNAALENASLRERLEQYETVQEPVPQTIDVPAEPHTLNGDSTPNQD